MKKNIGKILVLSSLLALNLNAFDLSFIDPKYKSTENGGSLPAIEAYQDGVGVFVISSEANEKIDHSAMNKLVYDYGEKAKSLGVTLFDYILNSGDTSITEQDKILATKASGKTPCFENPDKVNQYLLNGVCQGGTWKDGAACNTDSTLTGMTYLNGVCQGGTFNVYAPGVQIALGNNFYTYGTTPGTLQYFKWPTVAFDPNQNVIRTNSQFSCQIMYNQAICNYSGSAPYYSYGGYSVSQLVNACQNHLIPCYHRTGTVYYEWVPF